jgi:hypothetical protein
MLTYLRMWNCGLFAISVLIVSYHLCAPAGATVGRIDNFAEAAINTVPSGEGSDKGGITAQELFKFIQLHVAQILKPNGAQCFNTLECQSGVCYNGTCGYPNKQNGSQCFNTLECQSGVCYNGTCGYPNRQNGSQCFNTLDCQSGVCYNGTCGYPNKPRGSQCFNTLDCQSGVCSANVCQ